MRLIDFINKGAICMDLKSNDKTAMLYELVDILLESGEIKNDNGNREKLFNILYKREKLGSTGIGNGVAIPHGKSDLVKNITIAIGISRKGIDFNAIDGEKTRIFSLLIAPPSSEAPHLRALARISRIFKNKTFRHVLMNAKSSEDIMSLIATEEEAL